MWLVFAALLWLFENNAATLALLAASAAVPLLSVAAAVRRSKSAELTAQTKGTDLTVRVKGTGLFALAAGDVSCENRLTGEQTQAELRFPPTLSGGSEQMLHVDTAHCGTLRLRPQVHVQDLFGLWQSGPLRCEEEYVTIAPQLTPLQIVLADNTAVRSDSEKYSQNRPGSDPSETFAIREYVPGDPIRQIYTHNALYLELSIVSFNIIHVLIYGAIVLGFIAGASLIPLLKIRKIKPTNIIREAK